MGSDEVGIIYKHNHGPALEEARKLAGWFEKKGIGVYLEEMIPKEPSDLLEPSSVVPSTVKWVVVIGGDGTLLGAARRVGRYGAPILGVNLGGLGFLTSIPLELLYPMVESMVAGELEIESRMTLKASVIRNELEVCSSHFLNDIVINKSALARIIDLQVEVDGESLTVFRADGLIVSTPTGSTAYNLAAGGPVVHPSMETLIFTPICAFTLSNRPIIIPKTVTVCITMAKESEEAVMLTFDGQVGFDLHFGDRVVISNSGYRIKLFRAPGRSYFDILRTKLMWGGGRP
ncbi:MAG: NAD(+)/NADH kinase [Desulfatiglandaceae bacterium]